MKNFDTVIQEYIDDLNNSLVKIEKELSTLPKGSVYVRKINNKYFVYRNHREGKKVISKYLGPLNEETQKHIMNYLRYKKLNEQKKQVMNNLKDINKRNTNRKKKETPKEVVDFAIGISTVDSKEPSTKVRRLLELLAAGDIDLETYDFAVDRL